MREAVVQDQEMPSLRGVAVRHGGEGAGEVLWVAAEGVVHAQAQGCLEGVDLLLDEDGRGGQQDPQCFGLQFVGEQDRFLIHTLLATP